MMLLLWMAVALVQESPEPPHEPSATAGEASVEDDLELMHEVRRTSRRVEELLDARFESPPDAIRAPADLRRVAAEIRLAKALPPDRLDARGRAWEDIGLGTPETPERLYRLLAEDLAGVSVDPTRRRLLVDPGRLTDEDFAPSEQDTDSSSILQLTGVRPDEPLVLHGLVHLLQRQEAGTEAWPDTTDELLAFRAWSEAQANLAAILYLFESVGVGPEVLSYTLDPGEVMNGDLLPTSIDLLGGAEGALLNWVYRDGFAQAATAFRDGGPAALRDAMASRPTTRDVKHLDRAPIDAEVVLDPGELTREGLALVDRDSVGEQGIVVIVSEWTGKANLGLIAADGWSGDSLYRWEDENGDGETLWITRWTSPEEATDFEYGYLRGLERRFPGSTASAGEAGSGSGEGPRRFEGEGREIEVRRAADEVRVRIIPR